MRSNIFLAALVACASATSLRSRQAANAAGSTYDDLSISGGVAGNAAEEAIAALGGTPDFASLTQEDLEFYSDVNSICNDAEKDAFNPAIEAADGEEADALQRGKIKNKVLKLTATLFRLQGEEAQGQDVADEIETEQTKLQNNISQDEDEAGNESTFLAFDATVG